MFANATITITWMAKMSVIVQAARQSTVTWDVICQHMKKNPVVCRQFIIVVSRQAARKLRQTLHASMSINVVMF